MELEIPQSFVFVSSTLVGLLANQHVPIAGKAADSLLFLFHHLLKY